MSATTIADGSVADLPSLALSLDGVKFHFPKAAKDVVFTPVELVGDLLEGKLQLLKEGAAVPNAEVAVVSLLFVSVVVVVAG